jgi:hypothetical protein
MTIVATIVLLVHIQPISHMAEVAKETTLSSVDLGGLRLQLVADAGAALLVLLAATTLSVYKPWGMTSYGQRKERDQYQSLRSIPTNSTSWRLYVLLGLIGVVLLLFIILHFTGGGLSGLHMSAS